MHAQTSVLSSFRHAPKPQQAAVAHYGTGLHCRVRALRRMAGLVFLLLLWVLAGACQMARRGRVFQKCNSPSFIAVCALPIPIARVSPLLVLPLGTAV